VSLNDGPIPLPHSGRTRPGWLVLLSGAALTAGSMEVALTLGLASALSTHESPLRLGAVVVGLLLARTRFAWWLWLPSVSVVLLFILVAYTPLVERPALALLRADAEGAPASAVVVYSGAMTDAGHIGDVALTRLVSGLDDARRLGIPHIALSEQERIVRGRVITTGADQRRLVGLLGGAAQAHVVSGVSNTYDESLAFAALARRQGWTHVRVVSSPLHARRACSTLEATGLVVTCAPATARDVALTGLNSSSARITVARAALHEAIGLVVYRARGWR
jgi:uncharacterized SAM-binding protein YcdF (DUF218 family)